MNPNEAPPGLSSAIDDILDVCVGIIAQDVDFTAYVGALASLHASFAEVMPEWPIVLSMARAVWRQTPQPALRYAPAVLPTPERNAPCVCGSGRKYKQCCLVLDSTIPLQQMNFLPLLLGYLPRRRWSELVGSRIALDMVFDTAMQMHQDGCEKDVCTLLEPWFVDDADFHARREGLFDALLDAYTELGRPRKKTQLLERALAVGDHRLRSAALQRKTTMLADHGDHAAAWKLFAEAQRADPQSPSLAHLEVTMLLSEGRAGEARDRARFWAHRLAAMRDPQLGELIGFMRGIAERGELAMTQLMLDRDPELRELLELLQAAPPVASLYTLDPGDGEAGALKAKPGLSKALRAWHGMAPQISHSPLFLDQQAAGDMSDWLPLLRERPLLWNAFEVLDTVVAEIRGRGMAMLSDALVRPLLDRAEQLLREVLRANQAEGKRLEWGWLQNRPALSLLGNRIAIDGNKPLDGEQVTRLEWLVCTLNPDDNQGFRHTLVRALLQAGRIADALALCERYPDDFAAMRYNHALALFAADRKDAAFAALRDVAKAYPKPLAWLLKTRPKRPRPDRLGVPVGGDEEAWIYRRETLALWEQLGAMDWLRDRMRAIRK